MMSSSRTRGRRRRSHLLEVISLAFDRRVVGLGAFSTGGRALLGAEQLVDRRLGALLGDGGLYGQLRLPGLLVNRRRVTTSWPMLMPELMPMR